jgi:hypothetical protein
MWPFKRKQKVRKEPYVCPHAAEYETVGVPNMCRKYGCPDDPNWRGDGCR